MGLNESLRDKLKGPTEEEIITNHLNKYGYSIDDIFSIAITKKEYKNIKKSLLLKVEVEDLGKDCIEYDWNIIGTVSNLFDVFTTIGYKYKDIFNIIGI